MNARSRAEDRRDLKSSPTGGLRPGFMDDLKTIAGRLADGAAGRTEADVRKFLLDAPLDPPTSGERPHLLVDQ